MGRNVEVKARIADIVALAARAARIADSGPVEIAQDDIFFRCDTGRLKLRTFASGDGELIYYQRSDRQGPKESSYVRSPTADPETLRAALAGAYGEVGRVRKQRTLFLIGRTRIHLDRVADLGDFLELEVVLAAGEPIERGVEEAHRIMRDLGVEPSQLVAGAYLDLLRIALPVTRA